MRQDQDAFRAIFETRGERRFLRRGEMFHHAGDPLRHLFLLTSGWVGRLRANAGGEVAFTAIHIAGDVVGIDAIGGASLEDDVVALTDAELLRVSAEAVRADVTGNPAAAAVLIGLLAADAGFLREALLAVGRQSSVERLATFVLQTRARLIAAGLTEADARRFPMPLTQAQLAAVTGMTGVHVNRVLRLLRDAGILDIRAGEAWIEDLDALGREARQSRLTAGRATG